MLGGVLRRRVSGSPCWRRILRACARCWSACPTFVVVGVGEWPRWLRIMIETPLGGRGAGVRGAGARSRSPRGGAGGSAGVRSSGAAGVVQAAVAVLERRVAGAWTETDAADRVVAVRVDRRGLARWATVQVGRHGRSVAEVAGRARL